MSIWSAGWLELLLWVGVSNIDRQPPPPAEHLCAHVVLPRDAEACGQQLFEGTHKHGNRVCC